MRVDPPVCSRCVEIRLPNIEVFVEPSRSFV